MKIAVAGAGAWGTALAALLADAGHDVALWGRDGALLAQIQSDRENRRYLPGRHLPPGVSIMPDIRAAVAGREIIVLAVPAASIGSLCTSLNALLPLGTIIVCASKGLDEPSRQTLDNVIARHLSHCRAALLSGPTFAIEIARGLPAAALVASRDVPAANRVQQAIAGERLRVYTTDDVTGVAIGGALKNVIAIAAGCVDGFGFGGNARAALITRGLHEMNRLAVRLGGNPLTLSGLAGLGDLILTCTGDLSRNRSVGLALARGETLAAVTARLGHVAEGVTTAPIAARLALDLGVEMPITAQVAAVLAGSTTPGAAVATLLSRESRAERA